jgi:hypothetical protein
MAAGTTQPDTVPGVEDLAVCGREEQDAGDWTAIGSEAWLLPSKMRQPPTIQEEC